MRQILYLLHTVIEWKNLDSVHKMHAYFSTNSWFLCNFSLNVPFGIFRPNQMPNLPNYSQKVQGTTLNLSSKYCGMVHEANILETVCTTNLDKYLISCLGSDAELDTMAVLV